MHIVSPTRFVIGLVFLVVAAVLLPRALKERGFDKLRQGVALSLLAAGLFLASGFGLELWKKT